MALFPEQFNQYAGQQVNGPVQVNLTTTGQTLIVPINPLRCGLLIAVPSSAQCILFAGSVPSSGTGLIVGPAPNYLWLYYQQWGALIMERWLGQAIGSPVTIIGWDVVASA